MTITGFYDGLIGAVYAAAIADQNFTEDDVFTRLVGGAGGIALELGSGTGRLLLRLLEGGHNVHGLEISEEMTQRCLTEAARRGLNPVMHRGTFAPLDPSLRGYAIIFCPLNAFSFVTDDELALESVASYVAALAPGGVLALAGSAGDASLGNSTDWVRRADVPVEDGLLARVWERRVLAAERRCLRVEREIQVVDPDGRVLREQQGKQMRRLRPIRQLAQVFADAGLTQLHAYGDDADYVLTGRA